MQRVQVITTLLDDQYELISKGRKEFYTVLWKRTGKSQFGPNEVYKQEQFPKCDNQSSIMKRRNYSGGFGRGKKGRQ